MQRMGDRSSQPSIQNFQNISKFAFKEMQWKKLLFLQGCVWKHNVLCLYIGRIHFYSFDHRKYLTVHRSIQARKSVCVMNVELIYFENNEVIFGYIKVLASGCSSVLCWHLDPWLHQCGFSLEATLSMVRNIVEIVVFSGKGLYLFSLCEALLKFHWK